jgi:hypothetical protein
MDLLLSPLGGTVDAAVQAGRKAFTPNPEQRALASDPEWNRKAGDIAEMLTPLPKAGSVAKGARVVGDAIGVQRKLSRAEAAASAAEKAATAARDAREAAMHRTRVQTLQRAGVQDLTPGQIKGGAARAKEVAQVQGGLAQKAYTVRIERANDSFQRATYNQVLEEIGARYKPTAPVGHEGVRAVQRMVSYAYDRILPHVKLKVDTKLEEALAANVNEAEQLRNPEARNFYTSVDRSVRSQLTPGATLDGKTFKEIESDLTRDIAALKSNPLHRREASLLENYLEILREGAERSSPPEVAKRLKAVNAAYSKLTKVEEAAARNPGAGGKFNTEDL